MVVSGSRVGLSLGHCRQVSRQMLRSGITFGLSGRSFGGCWGISSSAAAIRARWRAHWGLWLLAWFVLFMGCTMAAAVAATGSDRCDPEGWKHYPMWNALEARVVQLRSPDTFFRKDGEKAGELDFDLLPDEAGAARRREALKRGLNTYPEAERPILMLAAADGWTNPPDGLATFFVLMDSVFVDDIITVLEEQGLADHARMLREGKTLFGPNFGTVKERYKLWMSDDDAKGIALDAALGELSARYRELPRLMYEAVERIKASPALEAIYEPIRAAASDDDRLQFLVDSVTICADPFGDMTGTLERFSQLPKTYGQIMAVRYFEEEMLNGSVHQAFFNSSGYLMPEVLEALQEWGLTDQAAAVKKGMDMFPSPYPRDLTERREFMGKQGEDFDNTLYDLTGPVDDGAMHEAMIRVAREKGILPQ